MPDSLLARATAYPLSAHLRTRAYRLRLRLRDRTHGPVPKPAIQRADLARRYLHGRGLEIGALHDPLRVPPPAQVDYVDRLTADELRARYPTFNHKPIVIPSVIDDSTTLATVADNSYDFVIANHVIEHIEDPIRALRTWLRVIRPGGVVYLAVPDKRRTFDQDRPSTPIDHLERDFADGPDWSRRDHYREYALLAEHRPPEEVEDRAAEMEAEQMDIHFHVWDRQEFLALLSHLAGTLDFDIETAQANGIETLVILRKE